jgi:hypothetical protein
MIIQIDNQEELEALKKYVPGIPEHETPCLLDVENDRPARICPLDLGVFDRVSASVAIERFEDKELYLEIKKMPPKHREEVKL